MGTLNRFEALNALRSLLKQKYCDNTADKYYFSVKKLFAYIEKLDLLEVEAAEIEAEMKKIKTKNDFSATKNGLKALQELFPSVDLPSDSFYKETSSKKRNLRKRQFPAIKADTIERKINSMRDKRQKLGFRVMLRSGLRVSELAALEAGDIEIEGDKIVLSVKNGKGGKSRTVSFIDQYTAERLPELIDRNSQVAAPDSGKVFYSDRYMQELAADHGIECHDLRRIYAQRQYRQLKTPPISRYEANGQLMEQMGHAKWRTTKIYLRRKIQF